MRVPWNWPKPEPMTANFAAMSDADLLRATIHELREAALEHHWDDWCICTVVHRTPGISAASTLAGSPMWSVPSVSVPIRLARSASVRRMPRPFSTTCVAAGPHQ